MEDQIVDISNTENDNKVEMIKNYNKAVLTAAIAAIAVSTFFGGYLVGNSTDTDPVTNDDLRKLLLKLDDKVTQPQQSPQPTQNPNQPTAPKRIFVSLDDDPVKGEPNAPVTIVEFSDFQCPFCQRFFAQTLPLIEENYIKTGKVKLVYRDLPIESIHPNAFSAHMAAECADEQGKFWDYHDILFSKQNEWNKLGGIDLKQKIIQYASDLELDISNFESCLASIEIENEINNDLKDATLYGATGTPAFYVGNAELGYVKISGAQPFSVFSQVIEQELGS